MKNIVLIALAVGFIAAGAYRMFATPAVSEADRARCVEIVTDRYGDSAETVAEFTAKCGEPGMVAMMDAQAANSDAQTAGQAIATANQGDLKSSLINWGLMGLGLGFLLSALGLGRRRV